MGRGFPLSQLVPVPLPRARVSLSGPRSSPSRSSGPNRPQNSWRAQGGSGRQHHVLMEIQLSKVSGGLGQRKQGGNRGQQGEPGAWVQKVGVGTGVSKVSRGLEHRRQTGRGTRTGPSLPAAQLALHSTEPAGRALSQLLLCCSKCWMQR